MLYLKSLITNISTSSNMAYYNGNLYFIHDGTLYTVSTSSGAATNVVRPKRHGNQIPIMEPNK